MLSDLANNVMNYVWRYFANDNNDVVVIRKSMIDICHGNMSCAVMLSQLLYWHNRLKSQTRWIKLTYDDWFNQCRLTERRVRSAKKLALELGFIETKIVCFNGAPCTHYRINFDTLKKAINYYDPPYYDYEPSSPLPDTPDINKVSDCPDDHLDKTVESSPDEKENEIMTPNQSDITYPIITESNINNKNHMCVVEDLSKETDKNAHTKEKIEKEALDCSLNRERFNQKFSDRDITIEEIFADCQEYYAHRGLIVHWRRFNRWLEREDTKNYAKKTTLKDTAQRLINQLRYQYQLYASQIYADIRLKMIPATTSVLPFEEWSLLHAQHNAA